MRPDTYIVLAILAALVIEWIWQKIRFRREKRAFVRAELGYQLACTAKALRDDLLRRQGNERIVDHIVDQSIEEEET